MDSSVFMTFAWCARLKNLVSRTWFVAALVSRGIALAEYPLQVPGNRIRGRNLDRGQLTILQAIALTVFVPVAVLSTKQPLKARLPVGDAVQLRRRLLRLPDP